jgi:hypothetical protein
MASSIGNTRNAKIACKNLDLERETEAWIPFKRRSFAARRQLLPVGPTSN